MVTNQSITLCLFELNGVTYGLPAAQVQEFVRMVAITPLPAAPAVVAGFVNLRSELIAVINLRQRFGLPTQPAKLSDYLLIAQASTRKVALWVDQALGVQTLSIKHYTEPQQLTSHTQFLKGIVEVEAEQAGQLILVQDLDLLLSDAEANSLQHALADALS